MALDKGGLKKVAAMKFFSFALFGITLLLTSTQMSSATDYDDWTKRKCERFLADVEEYLDDYRQAGYGDDRYSHLSHYNRLLKLKIRYCIKLVYGHDDNVSPHGNDEAGEWQEAYNR